MLSKLRPRSAYDVMAALSLFIVLGGTSYAVATGSIGSREIKNNSILSKDIRNNQVRSGDVRNGSLLGRDFRVGELPAGPAGPPGATGATGPRGATGSPGFSGRERVQGPSSFDSSSPKVKFVQCPAGKQAISGGYDIIGGETGTAPFQLSEVVVNDLIINEGVPGSVFVRAYETDPIGAAWQLTAYLVCANPSP